MTAIFLCENSNVQLEWIVTDGAQDNDEVEIEVASGHRILTCKSTSLKGGKQDRKRKNGENNRNFSLTP
jgi:hypothetical protein